MPVALSMSAFGGKADIAILIECGTHRCGRPMLISGRCHCGNISFALDWRPEPSEIPARACTCSFCAKHGGVWTSCPTGSLTVSVKDRVCVSKYAFGTKTAEFHVCTACGVVPVVTSRIDGRLYAVGQRQRIRERRACAAPTRTGDF